jgi:hypothetical protein
VLRRFALVRPGLFRLKQAAEPAVKPQSNRSQTAVKPQSNRLGPASDLPENTSVANVSLTNVLVANASVANASVPNVSYAKLLGPEGGISRRARGRIRAYVCGPTPPGFNPSPLMRPLKSSHSSQLPVLRCKAINLVSHGITPGTQLGTILGPLRGFLVRVLIFIYNNRGYTRNFQKRYSGCLRFALVNQWALRRHVRYHLRATL